MISKLEYMIYNYPLDTIFLLGLWGVGIILLFYFCNALKNKKLFGFKKNIVLGLLFLALICGLWGRFVAPYNLVVRTFVIENEKFPRDFSIAIISDLHVGPWKKKGWILETVTKINELNPELTIIPGDFLNGLATDYRSELSPLKKLKSPVFATLGNHDYKLNNKILPTETKLLRQSLKNYGVEILENETKNFRGILLAGLGDNYLGYDDLSAVLPSLNTDNPSILITHSPDIILENFAKNIPDFIITGHTHCGQIRLPWLGAIPYTIPTINGKKLEKHWYKIENKLIFVTCGVGEVGIKARFFNPPEIVIFKINPRKNFTKEDIAPSL